MKIILFILIIICAYTDGKENKIRNKYIISAILIGLIFATITSGVDGLKESLLGMIVPFVCLFPLFYIRAFGAGDVKLLSAIGALMGWKYVVNVFIYSLFVAGIMCIIKIVGGGDILKRLKKFVYYIFLCIYSFKLLDYPDTENKETRIPFGVAIFIGTCIYLITGYNLFF